MRKYITCIHAEKFVITFNYDCGTKVAFHQLPDLVNNHTQLKGEERVNIDLLIDYVINFAYLPILTNAFGSPFFAFQIFKD